MFQKAYVMISLSYVSILTGFVYGQTSGLISSLQKNEEGLDLNEEQISLIASILTLISFIGLALAAFVTDKMGRRWPFIISSIMEFTSWIILYFAREMYQFVLSRVFAGTAVGAFYSLTLFVTPEYSSPSSRVFYVNIVTVIAPAIGTGLGHILGTFLQWRTVALIGTVTTALSIFLPYFWVESPHWLASKGKFKECERTFQKLHDENETSAKELQLLINYEKKKLEMANQIACKTTLKRFLIALKHKYFWDIIILSLFICGYIVASGKLTFSILGLVIIEEITGTSNIFLYTLLVDVCMVLGPCISCFIIRKTPLRTLLFSSGFIANAVLIVLSSCFYFRNGQNYYNWINMGLLALYFIIINAGPYPVLETLNSEIFPLELKLYIYSITGSILVTCVSVQVFLTPNIVRSIGYHGMFLMYACTTTICLCFIWFKLPETKDKTLQEIEIFFKTKNLNIEEGLNSELLKSLI